MYFCAEVSLIIHSFIHVMNFLCEVAVFIQVEHLAAISNDYLSLVHSEIQFRRCFIVLIYTVKVCFV